MTQFERSDIERLVEARSGPCVSIYAPMIEAGAETRQNRIRFKNLVQEAEQQLKSDWEMSPEASKEFLQPLRGWIEDTEFWQHQGRGLAVYRAADLTDRFKIPLEVRERVVVQERFHIGSLLPLLTGDGRYYVLALSQKSVRLFEGSRDGVHEIDLGDTPRSLEEAVGRETEEFHLQYHTSSLQRGGGEGAPVYHGQGGGEDDATREIAVFFKRVASGVDARVANEAPLVLACVEYLAPIYRQASQHDHLLEEIVAGNPDRLSGQELRERAWELVEPVFDVQRQEFLESYRGKAGTGLTTAGVEETLLAAVDGRVEVLFVVRGVEVMGRFDAAERRVDLGEQDGGGARDLKEETAVQVLLHGGTVLSIDPDEMPAEGARTAAILRF